MPSAPHAMRALMQCPGDLTRWACAAKPGARPAPCGVEPDNAMLDDVSCVSRGDTTFDRSEVSLGRVGGLVTA